MQFTVFGGEDGFVGDALLRVGHDVVDVLRRRALALLAALVHPLILSMLTHGHPSINQSINQSIIHAVFVHHLHRRRVNSLARSLNASVVSRPSLIYCHVSWTRTKDIRLPPTSAPPDLTNVS